MNERILIIDDDPGFLTLLKAVLEQEGYTIHTANNGTEGLEQAHRASPDLIILDVVMPGTDGWQVCQQLRQTVDTPIIVFSGRASTQDVIKGFAMGAEDYVTKPCKLSDLKERVYKLAKRAGQYLPEGHDDRFITTCSCASAALE